MRLFSANRVLTAARKFAALPFGRKLQFMQCWLVLVSMRIGLLVVPARLLLDLGKRISGSSDHLSGQNCDALGRELAWMITRCARTVPGAKCLAQALALQLLLGRKGCACELHIGVSRTVEGEFSSHAWIVLEGQTILGGAASPLTYRSIVVSGRSA